MDGATLIKEIASILAWPATVIIALILLRKPLFELIPFAKKIKYKDLSIEFSREVENLKREFEKAIPLNTKLKETTDDLELQSYLIEGVSPRASIIDAWRDVESAIFDNLRRHDLIAKLQTVKKLPRLGHVLLEANIINKDQFDIIYKLKELRNQAVHADDFALNIEDVQEYLNLAVRLSAHLRGL